MKNASNYLLRGIPIKELLTGPLLAVSQANSAMTAEQVWFLLDYCFTKTEDAYHPITIHMKLTRSVIQPESKGDTPELKQVSLIFDLPLITLIPINSLSVEQASISFELEITSQYSSDKLQNKNLQSPGKSPPVQLAGNISYDSKETLAGKRKTHYAKKNNAKISLQAKVGTLPLPLGLTTVLEAYTKNIQQNCNIKQ